MAQRRFEDIDFLRALAIIGMIVTHVLSYNLGTDITNTIWNYLHFVVPLFVFCSGYVMYRQFNGVTWTTAALVPWYKKRAIRLLTPFVVYTFLHYALWYVFPKSFSGLGLIDYSWLPILFLELMLVTPIYLSLWKTRRIYLIAFLTITTFIKPPIDYRLYMWLPWSTMLLLSFAASDHREKKIPYLIITLVGFSVFIIGNILLNSLRIPLTLTLHKYPPDIFYLSYGVSLGSLLLFIEPIRIFHVNGVKKLIRWISTYSYELFFAHYIILDFVITLLRR